MSGNLKISVGSVSHSQVSAPSPYKPPPKPFVSPSAAEPMAQKKTQKQMETEVEQESAASNLSVHFRVNEETNELTVFVVDRSAHRVLRSIPISELYKMSAGELVKLAA